MGIYDTLGAAKKKQAQYDAANPGPGSQFDHFSRDQGQREQTYNANYDQDRGAQWNALQGGQSAFESSARSAVDAAMPSFYSALQGVRENAIRRGVQNGLGTSYEGDVASAFQRNIANSISGQALNLWNSQMQGFGDIANRDANMSAATADRYGEGLNAQLDRKEMRRNRKAGMINSGIGAIGALGGAALGMMGGKR